VVRGYNTLFGATRLFLAVLTAIIGVVLIRCRVSVDFIYSVNGYCLKIFGESIVDLGGFKTFDQRLCFRSQLLIFIFSQY